MILVVLAVIVFGGIVILVNGHILSFYAGKFSNFTLLFLQTGVIVATIPFFLASLSSI